MKFFRYLISKTFYKYLGIIIVSFIALIILTFVMLNVYTNHGESVSVPDFTGLTIEEVEKLAKEKEIDFEVVDSVFTDKVDRGAVIDQVPLPDHKVKRNRKVYITINSFSPQKVQIPNFTDLEMRSANSLAETYGLKLNVEKYIPDISTTILKQKFNGKIIEPNSWIEKGSTIDLIVGKGRSNEKVLVPSIIGLSRVDAESKLSDLALQIGAENYDETSVTTSEDSTNAKVYKQSPGKYKNSEIRVGSSIDIWLTNNKELIPVPDSTITESISSGINIE